MRKFINKIKDKIEDGFRRVCAPMEPGTRIMVIMILVVVFATTNLYVMFRAIYNIGREDQKWEKIDSEIKVPDMDLENEFSGEDLDEVTKEMQEFFNEHFKQEENDTTEQG